MIGPNQTGLCFPGSLPTKTNGQSTYNISGQGTAPGTAQDGCGNYSGINRLWSEDSVILNITNSYSMSGIHEGKNASTVNLSNCQIMLKLKAKNNTINMRENSGLSLDTTGCSGRMDLNVPGTPSVNKLVPDGVAIQAGSSYTIVKGPTWNVYVNGKRLDNLLPKPKPDPKAPVTPAPSSPNPVPTTPAPIPPTTDSAPPVPPLYVAPPCDTPQTSVPPITPNYGPSAPSLPEPSCNSWDFKDASQLKSWYNQSLGNALGLNSLSVCDKNPIQQPYSLPNNYVSSLQPRPIHYECNSNPGALQSFLPLFIHLLSSFSQQQTSFPYQNSLQNTYCPPQQNYLSPTNTMSYAFNGFPINFNFNFGPNVNFLTPLSLELPLRFSITPWF